MINNIKACIFDLDGTLLDTISDIGNAMNKSLVSFGLKTHNIEKYKDFVGSGTKTLIKRAIGDFAEDDLIEKVLELYKKNYKAGVLDTTIPFKGTSELLNSLKQRGIICSVLSNKPDEMTKYLIKKCFPSHNFAEVIGQKDGYPIKPDPALALHILKKTAVDAKNTVFIGDSAQDIKTALNAGIVPLGVLWGYQKKEELIKAGAEFLFDDISELSEFIGKNII